MQDRYHTEQELWQAFLSGNKDAFAALFEEYADAMYAYGCKMTADVELVKDTVQDVFVKLYNNRAGLHETTSVKGYLFVAMKRTLLNRFQMHRMVPLEQEEVLFEIELLSRHKDEDDDESYSEEMRLQLSEALKELTHRQREAVYLYYIQEIPLTELPDLLGMNYQSTRNLLHRAMMKLRQHIGSVTSASVNMSFFLLQYLSK